MSYNITDMSCGFEETCEKWASLDTSPSEYTRNFTCGIWKVSYGVVLEKLLHWSNKTWFALPWFAVLMLAPSLSSYVFHCELLKCMYHFRFSKLSKCQFWISLNCLLLRISLQIFLVTEEVVWYNCLNKAWRSI